MGLLDAVLGNASEIDADEVESKILAPGETVEKAYQLIRDYFIFTDRRLILVDKQGVSGKKMAYHTLPYESITRFSIETAGSFDRDAELSMWVRGRPQAITKEFSKKLDIYEVERVLASYVLKSPA